MEIVVAILREQCSKFSETALLQTDAFGKVVVSLEEMLRDGNLFHTSSEMALKMSKLKKF